MELYKEKYEQALERARIWRDKSGMPKNKQGILDDIFPELAESEDEKVRKEIIKLIRFFYGSSLACEHLVSEDSMIAWLEKQKPIELNQEMQVEPQDKGEISDGYHTFNELYNYRMLYNAGFFNLLPKKWVHKSKKHYNGEECFGGGWFIVMANLPTGQISNHYELKDWDLFHIPEKEVADEWDGHTPQEASERLHKYLLEKQGEQKEIDYNEELKKCKDNPLYFFDKYVKVKLKEQKPAWSEEDERNLQGIIDEIEANKNHAPDYDIATYDRFLSWLKGIKDRL